MAKFAILLPVYNGRPYLERCVESVLRQSHTDFELWIGDDGSTDGSREYAQSIKDPRIRVLTSSRLRLFRNLNSLLAHTQAPYVRVLCQDDLLEPECLARELRFLENHPDVAWVFTKGRAIDEGGNVLRSDAFHDLPEVMPPLLTLQHLFYHGCFPGNLSTVAIRRSHIASLGGFDASFEVAADYEMWLRLGKRAPVGVLHEHLVSVRNHGGQLSMAKSSGLRFIVENRKIRQRILPLLPAHVQAAAHRFQHQRHDVLDFHFAMRALLSGRWATFWGSVKAMGWRDWLLGGFWWLWTLNNRRHRPQASWLLPENPRWRSDERDLQAKAG